MVIFTFSLASPLSFLPLQDTLEMCSKEIEFKCILFALCYFHAVVAERRKFGAQGWNRSYPFNNGDLTISINVLYNYLEANPKVRKGLTNNRTSGGEGAKPWFAAQTPARVGAVQQGCGTHTLSMGWEQSPRWLSPWLGCAVFLTRLSAPNTKRAPRTGVQGAGLGFPPEQCPAQPCPSATHC